jgi:hypothetical protein
MKGPFSLQELKTNNICKSNGVSGIYIWGVKYFNEYIPLYVGKGRNVHERIFQHLSRWRGGEYRIPKWEIVIGKEPRLKAYVSDEDLLYIPHGANQYSDFLNNSEIKNCIENVIKNFFCVFIEINGSNLRDEEDELASLIGKDKLISTHRKSPTSKSKLMQHLYAELWGNNKKTSP